jgi:3-methyladenine DNA glycosylase AlkD
MTGNRTFSSIASDIADRVAASADFSVTGLRSLRRQISRELRSADPAEVVRIALFLIKRDTIPRWFTYELLNQHAALRVLQVDDIERLGAGISSWGDVDTFATYVSGPAYREGQLEESALRRWATSDDRWWRRAALVSTVALNCTARGGRGDAERTFVICDLLLRDRDDMVVKAMSWALRELARKEPGRVEAYLATHGDVLAARVLREVNNKLRTGLKNPGRTG